MTRTREDGKEEVFSACIKHDDTRYLGGNKSPSIAAIKLLGNYNTDGSNFSTYPAVYRGILNFFGDIWTFIRDVAIINKDTNYNSVYLLKKVLIILILQ